MDVIERFRLRRRTRLTGRYYRADSFNEKARIAMAISRMDDDITPDGKRWISTENGQHLLINGENEVVAGAGGALNGEKLENAESTTDKPKKARSTAAPKVNVKKEQIKKHEISGPKLQSLPVGAKIEATNDTGKHVYSLTAKTNASGQKVLVFDDGPSAGKEYKMEGDKKDVDTYSLYSNLQHYNLEISTPEDATAETNLNTPAESKYAAANQNIADAYKTGGKYDVPNAFMSELKNMAVGDAVTITNKFGGATEYIKTADGEFEYMLAGKKAVCYTGSLLADLDKDNEQHAPTFGEPKPDATPQSDDDYVDRFEKAFRTNDPEEFDDIYREQTGNIWKSLTDEEKSSLYRYTDMAYVGINNALREKEGDELYHSPYNDPSADIDNMTAAIDQSELKEETILYRGIGINAFERMFGLDYNDLTPENCATYIGQSGTDDGFMSCGGATNTGFDFKPVQLEILAPAGTKGLYVEPFSAHGAAKAGLDWDGEEPQSDFSDEFETILQRGTSVQIVDAEYYNGQYYFKVAVTGQNPNEDTYYNKYYGTS